jgi:hypothetical protein
MSKDGARLARRLKDALIVRSGLEARGKCIREFQGALDWSQTWLLVRLAGISESGQETSRGWY